jgi:predicted ABC-type transport system involved in lysophospholipase L1 biosynthesis ATPase subunit
VRWEEPIMRRFNRDLGTTFLVVTHATRIAERCDAAFTADRG